jgi:hypothetical protein
MGFNRRKMEDQRRPQFVTADWVRRRLAVLSPPDMQRSGVEIDLRPFQIAQFGCP